MLTPNLSTSYNVIKFEVGLGSAYPLEKTFEVTGDHIYCAEINGANQIYMKLGTKRNPWIPVRQGDTLSRDFRKVYLRSKIEGEETSGYQTAVFYVSHGPLFVERAPISYGLKRGFVTWAHSFANGTPVTLNTLLQNAFPNRRGLQSVFKYGGSLHAYNTSDANLLLFGVGTYTSLPTASEMYAIGYQREKVINIDGSLRGGDQECTVVSPSEIYFASDNVAAPLAARFMLSAPDFDYTRLDADNAVAAIPRIALED